MSKQSSIMKGDKNPVIANYPWVFWINISFRKWFSFYWTTRGANFRDIQIWRLRISIGRPWLQSYLDSSVDDFGSSKYIHKTNKENLRNIFSFKINHNQS